MASVCFFARRLFSSSCTRQTRIFTESLKSSVPKAKDVKMRNILKKRYSKAYDAEGKTVAFVVNKRTADVLCVEAVRTHGFLMATGEEYAGPLIVFPHSVLSWHVHSSKDINEESLVLFKVLEPKLDIIILGYGTRHDYNPEIHQRFSKICKNLDIRFEALPTEQACGIFNFLALEQRFVAGAFIPPTDIDVQKLDRRKKFHMDDLDDEDEEPENEMLEENKVDKKFIK